MKLRKHLECLKVFPIKVAKDPKVFGQFLPGRRWTVFKVEPILNKRGIIMVIIMVIKDLKNFEHFVSKFPAAG